MSNFLPKITIITPSYNQGAFIERTILSIINQNYPNLEYIIIDGGSTDESVDIIKKYESSISYWVSEEDNGQAEAINKGIKKATGEIINWINSDDLLEKDALLKIAQAYDPSVYYYLGKTHMINNEDESIGDISQTNYSGLNKYDCLEVGLNQPASFFNNSVIKRIGFLSEELHYSFDLDFWKRFLLHFEHPKVKVMDSYFASFRIHETSKTNLESQSTESSFSVENNSALKSYFSILSPKKASIVNEILQINTNTNLTTPILNKRLVELLADEIIYNFILKLKKEKGLTFVMNYSRHLTISYLYRKLIRRLGAIKK